MIDLERMKYILELVKTKNPCSIEYKKLFSAYCVDNEDEFYDVLYKNRSWCTINDVPFRKIDNIFNNEFHKNLISSDKYINTKLPEYILHPLSDYGFDEEDLIKYIDDVRDELIAMQHSMMINEYTDDELDAEIKEYKHQEYILNELLKLQNDLPTYFYATNESEINTSWAEEQIHSIYHNTMSSMPTFIYNAIDWEYILDYLTNDGEYVDCFDTQYYVEER